MTLRHITDLKAPIGQVLEAAGEDGLLIESGGKPTHAVIPLDDELIDYLLERSPKFIQSCREIREQMRKGDFVSHDAVRNLKDS